MLFLFLFVCFYFGIKYDPHIYIIILFYSFNFYVLFFYFLFSYFRIKNYPQNVFVRLIRTFWIMFFLHAPAIFSDFQNWITNIYLLDVAPEMFLYCFLSFPRLWQRELNVLNPRICPGMLLIVSVETQPCLRDVYASLSCWNMGVCVSPQSCCTI